MSLLTELEHLSIYLLEYSSNCNGFFNPHITIQQVSYDSQLSPIRPVQSIQFGVSHGSILGPLLFLFVLYTANLNKVIASHGLQLHQYADNCQVCVTTSVDDAALAADRLAGCVADVGV